MDPLAELAANWRDDAERFRDYGANRLARTCEKHADELEAASAARQLDAVTLEEAAEIGGYSYSHLQHLVADDTIPNVGSKGSPRIRRRDVPVKPGHGRASDDRSRVELVNREVERHREREGGEE